RTKLDASGFPYNFDSITDEWIERMKQQNASISFLGLVDDCFALKCKDGIRVDYRRQFTTVRNLVSRNGLAERLISDIRPSDLEALLKPYARTTYNLYHRVLHTVFDHAVDKDYLTINPVDKLHYFKEKKTTVRVFPNHEIEGILTASLTTNF